MMRSATDFLPSSISMLMNLASNSLLCFGSGRIWRRAATRLLGMGKGSDLATGVLFGVWACGVRSGLAQGGLDGPTSCPWSRGGPSLRALGAVLGAALPTLIDTGGVQGAAHGVVAHARQVLDTTATDEHDRVLLEVVTLAADVGGDLESVGQAHAGDLTQGGVGLLGGRRIDAGADAALLRTGLQGGHRALHHLALARLADQLIDRRHTKDLHRRSRAIHKMTATWPAGRPAGTNSVCRRTGLRLRRGWRRACTSHG